MPSPQDEIEVSNPKFKSEIEDALALVRSHTMLPTRRLVSLYQQVSYCELRGIPGSLVECGTWKGGAVGVMALANRNRGASRRHLHLFDSFEGIPEPDEQVDGERALWEVRAVGGSTKGDLTPVRGFYERYADGVGTVEDCTSLLETTIRYPREFLHYHKGWFQNTLPEASKKTGDIALLRVDADWHASTKVCLEGLYDRVVREGFVIVDDYGTYEGCRTAVDEFMERRKIRAYLHPIDSEAVYWIKPS